MRYTSGKKGKSIPTVDNLIILSALFKVPIEDIIAIQKTEKNIDKSKQYVYNAYITVIYRSDRYSLITSDKTIKSLT